MTDPLAEGAGSVPGQAVEPAALTVDASVPVAGSVPGAFRARRTPGRRRSAPPTHSPPPRPPPARRRPAPPTPQATRPSSRSSIDSPGCSSAAT